MGIKIEITNVNKESSFVSYSQDGESKTAEVVTPANIKYAKVGQAEASFSPEGKIVFLKSLEAKQTSGYNPNGGYQKPESKLMAISTVEVLEGVTLKEFQAVYNQFNIRDGGKNCKATSLFQTTDGKYDVALYVTTFVPKDQSTGPEM